MGREARCLVVWRTPVGEWRAAARGGGVWAGHAGPAGGWGPGVKGRGGRGGRPAGGGRGTRPPGGGGPAARHGAPPLAKLPIFSFFLVSTDTTGSPAAM